MVSEPIEKSEQGSIAPGGAVIRRARLRAGLSQHELASRLSTSQSLVARWEAGSVEPGFATVVRAVRACGLELEFRIAPYDVDHDLLVDENLRLPPDDRLRLTQQAGAALDDLREKSG
jgi:transcriptional regulator with XRE-family HTH domain